MYIVVFRTGEFSAKRSPNWFSDLRQSNSIPANTDGIDSDVSNFPSEFAQMKYTDVQ